MLPNDNVSMSVGHLDHVLTVYIQLDEARDLIIIIIIINLFATNQNIHNNHRVYMMAGRQKN